MSKRSRGRKPPRWPRVHDEAQGMCWVVSDVAPDGRSYVPMIQLDADRTFVPKDPVGYALAVIRACEYAAYDAAVVAQMAVVTRGNTDLAASVVRDLRNDRPPVAHAATAPLRFEPIVAARDRSPQLLVTVDGLPYTQWSYAEAVGHAVHVLRACAAVDLDAAYRRYLVGTLGTEPARADAVIGDLRKYRQN